MEDNARLHNQDADHLAGKQGAGPLLERQGPLGLDLGRDDTLANVLDEEGDEQAGHEDGSGRPLVAQVADAGVSEHERRVRVEL